MTIEEFNELATSILNDLNDVGTVSTKLDDLRSGFNEEVGKREIAETEKAELEEKNASLQQANMDLFLRIGTPVKEEVKEEVKEVIEKSYDDLFDDNGELK